MELPKLTNPVAYFCNEFAIDNDLPTYAGGLGVLAGDFINEAANMGLPFVGVGLLYKGKHFVQHITGDKKEEKRDSEFDHDTSFLRQTTVSGKPLEIHIPTPDGEIKIKSYHLRLSDTCFQFFLSTDIDGNPAHWISDMDTLYGGDEDSQIRQQIILGIGGARLLKALRIKPAIIHLNEGRPSLCAIEFASTETTDKIKKKTVYTNHTLVAAGNPIYPLDKVKYWLTPIAQELKLDLDQTLSSGKENDGFSITKFAMSYASRHNAVSKVHEKYAKQQFPDINWISITNGIHMNRWQDSDYRNPNLSDAALWNLHNIKKRELLDTVIKRTGFGYDPNKLVISWARRLADYKQPKAIFSDIKRLKEIITNVDTPIQILFAGNSHSADKNSKSLVEEIIDLFSTELSGHAIFVPNYNISLGNHMTSGSDIWLNTPMGNLEACGTSGMKAISNGVLNCTVIDGWTSEVDWNGVGWELNPKNLPSDFYKILENEILPEFFQRNEDGLPQKWIERMRKSIDISKNYSAEKMLLSYNKLLYKNLFA